MYAYSMQYLLFSALEGRFQEICLIYILRMYIYTLLWVLLRSILTNHRSRFLAFGFGPSLVAAPQKNGERRRRPTTPPRPRYQGARLLFQKQKEHLTRRLEKTEESLASAEGREAQRAEELSKAREDLAIKAEENQILQNR